MRCSMNTVFQYRESTYSDRARRQLLLNAGRSPPPSTSSPEHDRSPSPSAQDRSHLRSAHDSSPSPSAHDPSPSPSPHNPSANGATYTSLGQRPRNQPPCEARYRSAAGRSAAAGGTTKLPSPAPPIQPVVRAKSVKPPSTQKIAKPPINTGDKSFQNVA